MTRSGCGMKRLVRITVFVCIGLLSACSDDELTPQQEIENYIDAAVEVAEKRSADTLDDMMHSNYLDQSGNNKKQLGRLLRGYFFQNKNIFLMSRIGEIEILSENEAIVDMHLAMAGSAISDIGSLASLRARIYRFELRLLRDGEWLLQHAKWQPASIADMQ